MFQKQWLLTRDIIFDQEDRAVTAFYERLFTLESQLRRLQEELWLG